MMQSFGSREDAFVELVPAIHRIYWMRMLTIDDPLLLTFRLTLLLLFRRHVLTLIPGNGGTLQLGENRAPPYAEWVCTSVRSSEVFARESPPSVGSCATFRGEVPLEDLSELLGRSCVRRRGLIRFRP